MKQNVVRAAAVSVPEFAPLDDVRSLDAIDWSRGPRVIKPRAGLGAKGVRVVNSLEDARQECSDLDLVPGAYMIEEYIDAPMLHCDSLVQRGRPVFVSVAEYLNKCGDYGVGRTLGSLFSTDEQLCKQVRAINERVVAALPIKEGSTHLELFLTADQKFFFCEIACRPPGGGIDLMIRRGYNISLIDSHIRAEAGLPVTMPRAGVASKVPLGSLGFYPDAKPHAGIAPESFKELGILEVKTYAMAGDGQGGVRHATDYTHLYLLTGDTEAALRSAIATLPTAFRKT
jgi:biotin carboxylase